MAQTEMKRVNDSYTTQVQVLTQGNLNGYNRLFGGKLMSWMDVVAAVAARRHSERNVTTVRVDGLEFHAPARANDTLVLTAHLCHVGRSSMDVCVHAYVEELNGRRRRINRAHFIMVALDEDERPTPVPGLILETEQQRREWQEAIERRRARTVRPEAEEET